MVVAIIVSRELGLMLPPELYTSPIRAQREAVSYARYLSRRRSLPEVAIGGVVDLGTGRRLHLIPAPIDPPWRACPLWLGIEWKEGKPSPRVTPMVADDTEARAWFERAAGRSGPTRCLDGVWYETIVSPRGNRTYVGVHQAKRICGPMQRHPAAGH